MYLLVWCTLGVTQREDDFTIDHRGNTTRDDLPQPWASPAVNPPTMFRSEPGRVFFLGPATHDSLSINARTPRTADVHGNHKNAPSNNGQSEQNLKKKSGIWMSRSG